jgi:hypothetical protein
MLAPVILEPPPAPIPPFRFTVKQERARDMLISDAIHCALGGGARSGKTFLLCRQVLVRAMKAAGGRHVIFRFHFNNVWASVVLDTMPKVVKLCFPELPSMDSMLNKGKGFMTLPNGSEIWFAGLDDKERAEKILGMEFVTIYFNECSQIPWASVVLARTRLAQKVEGLVAKAFYDFNPPSKKHWTFVQFVDKKNPEDKRYEPYQEDFGYYSINPKDNIENLDAKYLRMLESLPEKAKNRFLLGLFADDSEGALWTEEVLTQNRRLGHEFEPKIPEFKRVIISVDPSGCHGPEDTRSDEIGIIVGGLGTDGHGYLIEDLSGRHAPEEWAKIVAEAYERHAADAVVAEKNFGGDMVRAVIHAADSSIPYYEVNASRGKIVRAEPISFIYEQNKIHHIGYFPILEEQMCAMLTSGYVGLKSPDRADALVWLWSFLFPKLTQKEDPYSTPTQVNTSQRSQQRKRLRI